MPLDPARSQALFRRVRHGLFFRRYVADGNDVCLVLLHLLASSLMVNEYCWEMFERFRNWPVKDNVLQEGQIAATLPWLSGAVD